MKINKFIEEHGSDLSLLLLRIWFGLVMALGHGWGKISNLASFNENVAKMGFWMPEVAGTFAASSEFIGGLLIALGLLFRPAAGALMLTMLAAAFVVHCGDPFGKKEAALAFAVISAALILSGPGRLTITRLWRRDA